MSSDKPREELLVARRTARWVLLITLVMAGVKAVVGRLTGSSALTVDAVHSFTDMVALGASWFGLLLASREPTRRFPYGFYRAETLGAAVASGVIIFLGIKFLLTGIERLAEPVSLSYSGVGLLVSGCSAAVAYGLYRWERRVSEETGSQSLSATAEEVRLDMGSSLAVFLALAFGRYGVPYLDAVVTLGISVLVLWAGGKNLLVSLLSLMDASLDPELEGKVTELLEGMEEVREVEKIRARKSGPFYFVEGHVSVAGTMDVKRSHALAHEAAGRVSERFPEVEGTVLHIEPHHPEHLHVLLPVEEESGLEANLAKHFGRAPFFLTAMIGDGQVCDWRVENNEARERNVRAGLAATKEFVGDRDVDVVICRDIGEIAFHGLRDHFVEVFRAGEETVGSALERYRGGDLRLLTEATHSSEKKVTDSGS